MGRIQSNVGLITGIPITDTVDQLIGVAGESRDLLQTRNDGLKQQQAAINSLAGRVLGLKLDLGRLKVASPFQARRVTSQNEDVLTATIKEDGTPPLGSFALRPARTASSQQLISQRFETLDDIQSAGSLKFGFGGFVDKGISLDQLNDGKGIERGEIKITDLGGNSAIVDLSLARTVDDVIKTINNESSLNVVASADGDSFKLTDTVGGAGTLSVAEVSGGTTAADLGLAGINTSSASATGADVYGLHLGTKLTSLNDGNGVRLTAEGVSDLVIRLSDGSDPIEIDLAGSKTLGDVVDKINEAAPGKLTAELAANGNGLVIEDLLVVGGPFSIESEIGSAADDLGITGSVVDTQIIGKRLVSGLQGTLVGSLKGGQGLDSIGSIDLTDRSGATATIDLSAAQTLDDIIDLINASGADVTASVNQARSGLVITDNSGGSGNLIIADNVDGTETATQLGIVVDEAQDSVNSGSLDRQILSEATLLSSLNGGDGVDVGDIRITDSQGDTTAIDLNATDNEAQTIGDVIDAINAKNDEGKIGVRASINDTGDGIQIVDTVKGEETLLIEDINGSIAEDLNLTRASKIVEVNGLDAQVVDGSTSYSVDLADLENSGSSVSLASLNDGTGITLSDIRITDSKGKQLSLDLNGTFSNIETVGELIETINSEAEQAGVKVKASLNKEGSGIKLTDSANGDGDLQVEDINGTAAADLKILSTDTTTTTINGHGLFEARSQSQGALESVAQKINELESGVTASVLNDGTGYRLQLVVDNTGSANEILLDAGGSGIEFRETSEARDALLIVGAGTSARSGVLVSSATNDFNEVVSGVDLTLNKASDTAVDVSVSRSEEDLVDLVDKFVSSYNTLRDDLGNLTAFDAEAQTTGLLIGTSEALRVDTELSRLITDRYSGVGKFQSLQEIGITVDDKGKLSLNKTKLKDAFEDDPQSLQSLFTTKDRGLVAKFDAAIESLAGSENGLLTNRDDSLKATIENNEARIERFNASLERKRERLLLQFYQLEQVIAGLQGNQEAINSFQSIAPQSIQ